MPRTRCRVAYTVNQATADLPEPEGPAISTRRVASTPSRTWLTGPGRSITNPAATCPGVVATPRRYCSSASGLLKSTASHSPPRNASSRDSRSITSIARSMTPTESVRVSPAASRPRLGVVILAGNHRRRQAVDRQASGGRIQIARGDQRAGRRIKGVTDGDQVEPRKDFGSLSALSLRTAHASRPSSRRGLRRQLFQTQSWGSQGSTTSTSRAAASCASFPAAWRRRLASAVTHPTSSVDPTAERCA